LLIRGSYIGRLSDGSAGLEMPKRTLLKVPIPVGETKQSNYQ
jgi:hypothetical protein